MLIKKKQRYTSLFISLSVLVLLALSCQPKQKKSFLFEVLTSTETGLRFTNKLTATPSFNMFNYMYFYNGAGVGAGDFNNDGNIDLFFASNQEDNKLFLNEGDLHFKDVTKEAAIPQDRGWSTGVSIVDINNDGLLDIYVCRVGNFETLHSKNQFLICTGINKNGVPKYVDKAQNLGVDFSGFSTQAAFLDYDMDGDLDMFLLNHSVHQNGTFGRRNSFLGTYHPLTGHRLFKNEKDHFKDVTKDVKINSSAIGYGLGICVSDINLDGYPDIYVGNDFHENDYLYINQKNGTFTEELTQRFMHTSKFSMGVDIADINNDAYPEIISVDMLPSDPYFLKRSLGDDDYDVFNMKIDYGYAHQYARNALQLNRKNGFFSDVALYAGVAATDWSWAPLWVDFDNDGLKDLFVSNGIPKRLNDIDYVNYVSNAGVQSKINSNSIGDKEMAVINNFPEIKLPNKFYRNKGNAFFEDVNSEVDAEVPTFSNGAVYADFDNDGDLDVVVNNIADVVILYQNKRSQTSKSASLKIKLKGSINNINAVGARAIVFTGNGIRTYEKFPVRGFQSSMETPIHIGLDDTIVDSAFLVWPDNTFQKLVWSKNDSALQINYQPGLPQFNYSLLSDSAKNTGTLISDITNATNLQHKHSENPFNEFAREPLIPFMVSREGPALAVADINNDKLDDVFIGSSKGEKSSVYIQNSKGRLEKIDQPDLDRDSVYEDVDAFWVDVNNDGLRDLVVASGGNEFYGKSEYLLPRVYLNGENSILKKLDNAFQNIFLTASCITPADINNDGYVDLFIGGRAVPWAYGEVPKSYILLNDKTGRFKDATAQFNKELSTIGFVKDATWFDLDKDGDLDLMVCLEWDGIYAFINNKGKFEKKQLTNKRGWWNFMLPYDVDHDGDIDLIAGNTGLNSRLRPTNKEPVKLYYNDFDNNGTKEQILTYYLGGKEIPFATKGELEKQMPLLKKKFLYAEEFAKASLKDLFTEDKLKSAEVWTADYFNNSILINNGKLNFETVSMPWEAQLTSYKTAVIVDANNDDLPDFFLAGNFYDDNIQMSRYDADYGSLLINKGSGQFEYQTLRGAAIKGQIKRAKEIKIQQEKAMILTRNNDSTMILKFQR